jgi:SAM-dependent methyltransferase
MALLQVDIDYFHRGSYENPQFWARLGEKPCFKGAFIVDLGCGHGSLCVDMAMMGARKVIGLDLNSRLIDFANQNLQLHYPQLKDLVEFRNQNLCDMPERDVDYLISKDTFEHVVELEHVLADIKRCLKPGGRLYSGFGPLWNSPFGDHGRTKLVIPWAHILLPERFLIAWRNRYFTHKATSIYDLGLNGLPLAEYMRIFQTSGLRLVYLRINSSERLASRLFSLLRKIPFCEEYFSHNIYCIMEKPMGEADGFRNNKTA